MAVLVRPGSVDDRLNEDLGGRTEVEGRAGAGALQRHKNGGGQGAYGSELADEGGVSDPKESPVIPTLPTLLLVLLLLLY